MKEDGTIDYGYFSRNVVYMNYALAFYGFCLWFATGRVANTTDFPGLSAIFSVMLSFIKTGIILPWRKLKRGTSKYQLLMALLSILLCGVVFIYIEANDIQCTGNCFADCSAVVTSCECSALSSPDCDSYATDVPLQEGYGDAGDFSYVLGPGDDACMWENATDTCVHVAGWCTDCGQLLLARDDADEAFGIWIIQAILSLVLALYMLVSIPLYFQLKKCFPSKGGKPLLQRFNVKRRVKKAVKGEILDIVGDLDDYFDWDVVDEEEADDEEEEEVKLAS